MYKYAERGKGGINEPEGRYLHTIRHAKSTVE